jgi:hypothetical protein
MTNQSNPHSRKQPDLRKDISDIIEFPQLPGGHVSTRDLRGHPMSSTELGYKLSLIMERFEAYTAEKSLLRAKDTLDKVYELSPTAQFKDWKPQDAVVFYERLKEFEKQLDKEIKASRLDAEGKIDGK